MSTTYVATAGLETAPLQDGSVLYNLKTGKFVMLNRSATVIWSALTTPKSVSDLSSLLGDVFVVAPSSDLATDVENALSELKALELVASRADRGAVLDGGLDVPSKIENPYASPSIRVLDEEELLNIFQMTAAEISVASCWWSACASPGCP